jgi:hypothetical protein
LIFAVAAAVLFVVAAAVAALNEDNRSKNKNETIK